MDSPLVCRLVSRQLSLRVSLLDSLHRNRQCNLPRNHRVSLRDSLRAGLRVSLVCSHRRCLVDSLPASPLRYQRRRGRQANPRRSLAWCPRASLRVCPRPSRQLSLLESPRANQARSRPESLLLSPHRNLLRNLQPNLVVNQVHSPHLSLLHSQVDSQRASPHNQQDSQVDSRQDNLRVSPPPPRRRPRLYQRECDARQSLVHYLQASLPVTPLRPLLRSPRSVSTR